MRPTWRILGLSCAAAVAWAVSAIAVPVFQPALVPAPAIEAAAAAPRAPQARTFRRYRTHPVAAARKSSPKAFSAVRRSQPVPAPRRHHATPVR